MLGTLAMSVLVFVLVLVLVLVATTIILTTITATWALPKDKRRTSERTWSAMRFLHVMHVPKI